MILSKKPTCFRILKLLFSLVIISLDQTAFRATAWMPQSSSANTINPVSFPIQREAVSSSSSRINPIQSSLYAQVSNADDDESQPFSRASMNGEGGGDGGDGGSASRIIPMAQSGKSQLAAAFTALEESDQYDAVLTGLCAKILDGPSSGGSVVAKLDDPAALLAEMNERNIAASPRSLMALIDATVKTQDALTMSDMLSLSIRNKNGLTQYGILQTEIIPMPASSTQQVVCRDGSRKTREQRLRSISDVPADDRGAEVTSALSVGAVVAFCALANVLHLDDITPFTNVLWITIVTVGVVDNFYDVLKMGSNLAVSVMNNNEDGKSGDTFKLPDKESLPLGLGSGKLTGTVVQGLTRLLSTDTERECQCEAAALYAAYTLGLPCFAFRPNSLEAAYLIAQSISENSPERDSRNMDPLLSDFGIMKVLIWLMAPVAMESMKHPQLICSDPREASGLLKRLEDNTSKNNIAAEDLWWLAGDDPQKERSGLLKWAYNEADILLRNNIKDVMEISQRLTGGSATIGDCVAAIERW